MKSFIVYTLFLSCFVFLNVESSGINDSPARNIQAQLNAGIESSPAAALVANNLARLQETPGDSRTAVTLNLAESLIDSLAGEGGSPVDKNDRLFESFTSPDKSRRRKSDLLNTAAQRLPESSREGLSAVDMDHVTSPKTNRYGKVVGGHWFENYALGQVLPGCFLGQDGKTLGVFLYPSFDAKTVRYRFDSSIVLNSLRSSRKVATHGSLTISRMSDDTFMGSYRDPSHSLKVNTLFPLLVVDPTKRDIDGNIILGTLGILSSDYNNIFNQKYIKVSPVDYNNMIYNGTPLHTAPGEPFMIDITDVFKRWFPHDLLNYGLDGYFPGKLYGYGTAT